MNITPRPGLSNEYPAIDGFAQKSSSYMSDGCMGEAVCTTPGQNPIRSDVLSIMEMHDQDFDKWYSERIQAVGRQLQDARLVGSIPHLNYGAENQKLTFGEANTGFRNHLETLIRAKDHLEKLRKVREQSK